MNTKDVLIKARTLISHKDNWIQQQYAEDKNGLVRAPRDPRACKFCAIGAIYAVIDDEIKKQNAIKALAQFADRWTSEYEDKIVVAFNDDEETTHEEVLEVYNKAIEALD